MKRVDIIGGSGFIGKNLVRILAPYFEIMVVDKFIDDVYFESYPDVVCRKLDLVEELLPEEMGCPDFIINLASIVTAERDLSLFDSLISTNLRVLLNLYERFKNEKRLKLFIQFGSSEEYGNNGSLFVETMREEPNSPYALVKQLTTNTALMLYRNYGFPAMVVRPGNLFGPGQNRSKFIPYVIDRLKANEPLDVTPCEQKRDFIHVDDFCEAIRGLLENYEKCVGEIVNVSSGESVSLKAIIEMLRKRIGSQSEVHYGALPYRENEAMDLKCNTKKLCTITAESRLYERLKNLV